MSGGLYGRIDDADASGILNSLADLGRMAETLERRGLSDAAAETRALLTDIASYERRAQTALERLQPVWRAVDLHEDHSAPASRVDEAVAEYRASPSRAGSTG